MRWTLIALVVPLTAVLACFGAWWWLPIPTLMALAVHQTIFWLRRDRPSELNLDDRVITLLDEERGAPITVEVDKVHVVSGYVQTRPSHNSVVVVLGTAARAAFAVQFHLTKPPALPHGVDVDRADRRLGGQAGVLRSVAPLHQTARQAFTNQSAVQWFVEHLPHEAWERTGLQLWKGEAPPVSAFGFHIQEPSGWLILDGSAWTANLTDGTSMEGLLNQVRASTFRRVLHLMRRSEDGPTEAPVEVPYLRLRLADDLSVAFPAPLAAGLAEVVEAEETDFHCHAAEGAALVAHLSRVLPGDRLPTVLHAVPD